MFFVNVGAHLRIPGPGPEKYAKQWLAVLLFQELGNVRFFVVRRFGPLLPWTSSSPKTSCSRVFGLDGLWNPETSCWRYFAC